MFESEQRHTQDRAATSNGTSLAVGVIATTSRFVILVAPSVAENLAGVLPALLANTVARARHLHCVAAADKGLHGARRRYRRKLRGRSDKKQSKRPLVSAGGVGPCVGGSVQSARARCLRWGVPLFSLSSAWGCFLCLLVLFVFSLPSVAVVGFARWLPCVAGCVRWCRRARVVSALRRGVSFRLCGCRPLRFVGVLVSAACACCRVCCRGRLCCGRALRGGCCRCRLVFVPLRCLRCLSVFCLPGLFGSLGSGGLPCGFAVESAVCARGRGFAASGVFANRAEMRCDNRQTPSGKFWERIEDTTARKK